MRKIIRNTIGLSVAILFLVGSFFAYDLHADFSIAKKVCSESIGKSIESIKHEIEDNPKVLGLELANEELAILKISNISWCEFSIENEVVKSFKIEFKAPSKEWKYEFSTAG